MIEMHGDILQNIDPEKQTVILHGCNCFHKMGAGIALYLKTRYPAIYAADKETPYGEYSKLGSYSKATEGNLTILNCYTQYSTGPKFDGTPPVEYHAIKQCLLSISEQYKGWEIRTPMIGCGLAGGDWDKVKSMFDSILSNENVIVFYL